MKITEALKILQTGPRDAKPFDVMLACGFTPLHLQNFAGAYLQQALPDRRVTFFTGLYGDLVGTVESLAERRLHAVAIAIEWADLDPRLGYRALGRWGPVALSDILSVAHMTLERIETAIPQFPSGTTTAVSVPTLPVPPLFHTPGWEIGEAESLLEQMLTEFRLKLLRAGVSFVNATRLAEKSPFAQRYDLKSDLLTGLPYTIMHAEALGSALALLLRPGRPKKGLITDLDDTLWAGLVGEVGPDGVSWDLQTHSGLHGLYQRLLSAFSEEGVLLAVASKNNPAIVQKTFQRSDILLRQEQVFPMEVHWGPKSGSVQRILRAWNIAADTVVYIDDSPMELAEVAAAHPGIECMRFPTNDYGAGYTLLHRVRDLFGKRRLSSEDSLRLTSIRKSAEVRETADKSPSENFLQDIKAVIKLDFCGLASDSRALELVNKTNQFNLNGIRWTESDWSRELSLPDASLIVVSYEDKFEPLGKISVMQAHHKGTTLRINVWVMSCRAFARRIEYQCLRACFERFRSKQIEFDFAPTNKNGPLQEFLTTLLGHRPSEPVMLTKEQFEQACPHLYHTVIQKERTEVNG
ncbi:MAG TPA: HAD-IIIC family phosphatase [Candidatus Polarisedimenticolia bacterium]|nr:HAD-IIIC family phosphatase [Candidatus Polarisedimenticolia bacterium]